MSAPDCASCQFSRAAREGLRCGHSGAVKWNDGHAPSTDFARRPGNWSFCGEDARHFEGGKQGALFEAFALGETA